MVMVVSPEKGRPFLEHFTGGGKQLQKGVIWQAANFLVIASEAKQSRDVAAEARWIAS
ncbi:hypothetical protein AB8Z38_19575 [Bradyrhizobium sp. LLZ17]|uniref:Uncharacterized protein n=1 Tax=Bradyrhizobium sp. LLZ17 TaxID=3239388 RepID=A0AB39XD40_9BRAD